MITGHSLPWRISPARTQKAAERHVEEEEEHVHLEQVTRALRRSLGGIARWNSEPVSMVTPVTHCS